MTAGDHREGIRLWAVTVQSDIPLFQTNDRALFMLTLGRCHLQWVVIGVGVGLIFAWVQKNLQKIARNGRDMAYLDHKRRPLRTSSMIFPSASSIGSRYACRACAVTFPSLCRSGGAGDNCCYCSHVFESQRWLNIGNYETDWMTVSWPCDCQEMRSCPVEEEGKTERRKN